MNVGAGGLFGWLFVFSGFYWSDSCSELVCVGRLVFSFLLKERRKPVNDHGRLVH